MDTLETPATPRMVDETLDDQGTRCTVTRIYKTDTETVRVLVYRDTYERQSGADVHLLNSERKWTPLVSEPVTWWHPATCHAGVRTPTVLCEVADRLITRAALILG
ncbi:hypothetical protein [Amycolatopsis sp. H20-H5]|uniref:hypothetical protein n=1 Tax=Amycolatopsis sp. H20-H5 TaxID=3046309 RepID=UPI002DB67C52|nr:hypothetical protein [Amycolatopsis sp. H20-H5]MEC3979921.1 hypothetical protein [Amycolatopsis sp. H20-H5]